MGRGGGRPWVTAKPEGWPVANALSLTVRVAALTIQGECCLWPRFQAERPVVVWPGLTLGGHTWGQLLAWGPRPSVPSHHSLDPTGEGEATSSSGGPLHRAAPDFLRTARWASGSCPCCRSLTVFGNGF